MSKFSGTSVKEVTLKDFDKNFNLKSPSSRKPGMLLFYQPWCGYCHMFIPEYIKLSQKKDIQLYALNGESNGAQQVFSYYQVSGVPTLIFMTSDGKLSKRNVYQGERKASDIYSYIKANKSMKAGCACSGGKKGNVLMKKMFSGGSKKKRKTKRKRVVKKNTKRKVKKQTGKTKRILIKL